MFYSTAEEKATPIGLTRIRSNTFNSTMHHMPASPQQNIKHSSGAQDLTLSPGSDTQSSSGESSSGSQTNIRSPKLFINCVEIRQRSRSLSTSSFSRGGLSLLTNKNPPPRVVPPKTCGSPEGMMSSTFPPPRRDLYSDDEHAQSLPSSAAAGGYHRRFQQLGSHHHVITHTSDDEASDDYNMDSNDDADDDDSDVDMMETESLDDDEHQMPFKMEQRSSKKRVSWRSDDNLCVMHTYKSDSRYYERNPFYGFGGKTEYGSDDEDYGFEIGKSKLSSPTTSHA